MNAPRVERSTKDATHCLRSRRHERAHDSVTRVIGGGSRPPRPIDRMHCCHLLVRDHRAMKRPGRPLSHLRGPLTLEVPAGVGRVADSPERAAGRDSAHAGATSMCSSARASPTRPTTWSGRTLDVARRPGWRMDRRAALGGGSARVGRSPARTPGRRRALRGHQRRRRDVRATDVQGLPGPAARGNRPLGKATQPVSIERHRVALDRPAASSSRWKSRCLRLRSNPAHNIAGA